MTQEQANTLVINADENILQGWLDLQRVWFDNRNDPDMMKAGSPTGRNVIRTIRARKCCQRSWLT